MKNLVTLSMSVLVTALAGAQTPVVITEAPNAQLPPQGLAPAAPAQQVRPQQQIRRSVATLDEEVAGASEAFRAAYARGGRPRMLFLYNRDMEDNDDRTMQEVAKVNSGVQAVTESGGRETRTTVQGGASVSVPKGPAPGSYDGDSLQRLRETFEQPFLSASAKIVDRDTAVRLHGLKEESVFSYADLPEAQRAQVAGVAKYADILVTVEVRRGTSTVRKVSGDYEVDAPDYVVRAISLKDARILATVRTSDVRAGRDEEVTSTRVALALMQRLAGAL
jgi:hypothetical protein